MKKERFITPIVFLLFADFMLRTFFMGHDPRLTLLIDGQLGGNVANVATDAELTAAVAGGTMASLNQTLTEDRTISGNSLHTLKITTLDSFMIASSGLGASIFDVRGFIGINMLTPGAFALTSSVGALSTSGGVSNTMSSGTRNFRVTPTATSIANLSRYDGDTTMVITPTGNLHYATRAYGQMYVSANTAGTTSLAALNTPVKVTSPAFTSRGLKQMTFTGNTLTYTGPACTAEITVEVHALFQSNNRDTRFHLRQNTTLVEPPVSVTLHSTNRYGNTMTYIIPVSTGDTFELWAEAREATGNVTVTNTSITFKKL